MTVTELEARMDSRELVGWRALAWLEADAARLEMTLSEYMTRFGPVFLGTD